MKKLLFALALLCAMPLCDAHVRHRTMRQQQHDNPIDYSIQSIREKLAEFAALSFDEKRERTDEIWDYIDRLMDALQSGTNIGREDAIEIGNLIAEFQQTIHE